MHVKLFYSNFIGMTADSQNTFHAKLTRCLEKKLGIQKLSFVYSLGKKTTCISNHFFWKPTY